MTRYSFVRSRQTMGEPVPWAGKFRPEHLRMFYTERLVAAELLALAVLVRDVIPRRALDVVRLA